jgi:hypothetical protein
MVPAGYFQSMLIPKEGAVPVHGDSVVFFQSGLDMKDVVVTSEVLSKMIIMGNQILSCNVLVVRSFFIL